MAEFPGESQTFPYIEGEGTQGLVESPMFPDAPLITPPANLEEVAAQAALVEATHSGKDFDTQVQETTNTIQSVGMDEVRRSIAAKEKEVSLGVAERAVKASPNEDTVSYFQQILDEYKGPVQKHAMEKAVVDIITPLKDVPTLEYYKQQNTRDFAARNLWYETINDNVGKSTFWEKALVFGRELVGFINTQATSSAIAEALDRKNTFSNWVSADAAINDFRDAYSMASAERRVELVKALIHGLERTSSLFGDKNAAQIAVNLGRVLTQTSGEALDVAVIDVLGLPLITAGKTIIKGIRVASELGKPANVAKKAGNANLAAELMAKDAIQGSKISGMSTEEIAREAFSMGKTPMERVLVNLGISQQLQNSLKAGATGLRTRIGSTLMPSSITPAQISRAAEHFENVYDAARNKAVYEYSPTDYREGMFSGTVKWQKPDGTPFLSKESAEAFGKEEGKVGVAQQVGDPLEVLSKEDPLKVGKPTRVYSTGAKQDITGRVSGGTFPDLPVDTANKFYLYGPTKQDKQGRFYREVQEYAAPGQQWVFKEDFTKPLPNEAIGIHTLADVASRNIINAYIPSLAASEVSVTQRGLGRSAQAKIAKDLTKEHNDAYKGLSWRQTSLVNKALIEGDALSEAAGAVGYVFNAIELASRGLSEKAIEAYYKIRILRDTGWLLRNQSMLRELEAQGMKELAFDGNAFGPALHAPAKPLSLGPIKSLSSQGKVKYAYNLMDGKLINLAGDDGAKLLDTLYAGGGMVIRLKVPEVLAGRSMSHLIINPKEIKLRDITMPVPYRPGEFARGYTDEYFIYMKRMLPDDLDNVNEVTTRTLRTAPSKKKAQAYVDAHNEALDVAFKPDLTDAKKLVILEQLIGKYTDAKAFLKDTKTGKIHPDERMSFHYNREQHSYLEDSIDEQITSGRMFTSLRGEKLLSVDPKATNTLDIHQSLGVELANISRYMTSEDIRITAVEKWMNTFGHGIVNPTHNKRADFLQPLDAGKLHRGLLDLKAEGKLSASEDLTGIDAQELLAFAERERAYIKNQLHVRTQFQKNNSERYKKFTEWVQGVAGKVLPETASDWIGVKMRRAEVSDFLRQANYHLTLGGGNLSQLIVQSMGAAIAGAVHPQWGVQSAKSAGLMRLALMSDNPNVWKSVGFFDSLTSLGFKNVNEFVDSVKAVRDSGILADIRSTALYNAEDGALDLFQHYAPITMIKNALVWPFNRGEEFARLTSWEIARREWISANPGKQWQAAGALREISARQKEFNLGMQAHNTAPWQQGVAGIPFQFLQYNLKLAVSQMHTMVQWGKAVDKHGWKAVYNFDNGNYRMFNPRQAAQILATQMFLFGMAGNGLRGLANNIWGDDHTLSEEQRMAIVEGFAGWSIYALTKEMDGDPAKLALGKRLGTYEWYVSLWDKLTGKDESGTATTLLMGPTKSSVDKVWGHAINLYQLFVYSPDMVSPDMLWDVAKKWPEVWAGYNNALKAYTYLQNEGIVTSKDGTPLAKINRKEAFAALLGMPSEAIAEYYENVKDSKKLYNTLTDLARQIHKIQLRRWDAINDGNTKLADELAELQAGMMPRDTAHADFVTRQLREKIWPGDTASDKIKRQFIDKMQGVTEDVTRRFRVLDN